MKAVLHTAFTDKGEHNCNFPAPGRNCYNIVSSFYRFYGAIPGLVLGKLCSAWQ